MDDLIQLVEASKALYMTAKRSDADSLDGLLEAQRHLWHHVDEHKKHVMPEWMTLDRDTLVKYYEADILLRKLLEGIAMEIDKLRES